MIRINKSQYRGYREYDEKFPEAQCLTNLRKEVLII